MRQRGGMKLSEKQRYKNEDRRQRFQEQYLRQSSIQSDFIPVITQARVLDSPCLTSIRTPSPEKNRIQKTAVAPVVFADKSSDDEEDYGRPQTRRNIDNDSEHASRNRASIDSAGQSLRYAALLFPESRFIGPHKGLVDTLCTQCAHRHEHNYDIQDQTAAFSRIVFIESIESTHCGTFRCSCVKTIQPTVEIVHPYRPEKTPNEGNDHDTDESSQDSLNGSAD
ncbi:hypothetical protein J6590_105814 [Homalodisca vitripennis]|nr:hypothetical protein J6590_105814 [Homalodisca vitripennis]